MLSIVKSRMTGSENVRIGRTRKRKRFQKEKKCGSTTPALKPPGGATSRVVIASCPKAERTLTLYRYDPPRHVTCHDVYEPLIAGK